MGKLKVLSIMVSLLLVLCLSVIACSTTTTTPTSTTTTKTSTSIITPSTTTTPKPITMKITTQSSATIPHGQALDWFAQELTKRIPGSEIKVFHGGSLYSDVQALEAMNAGSLEACWASSTNTSGIIPEVSVWTLPMTITSLESINALPKSAVGKLFENAAAAKGFLWQGWANISPYTGVVAKSRILAPGDWKGKKVRAYDKVVHPVELQAVGASAINMTWGDTPTALQTNTLDAALTSLNGFGLVKDFAPYMTAPGPGGFGINYYIFLVSKSWWDKLPADTKDIVQKLISEACIKESELQAKADADLMAKYQTKDPTKPGVYVLSSDEESIYRTLWQEIAKEAILKAIGAQGKTLMDSFITFGKDFVSK